MADNVTITSGANSTPPDGTVVSTDEAASGHIQRVKLTVSADGSDTHLQADSDGLLVNLGANNDVIVSSGMLTLTAGTNNIGDVDILTVPAPLSTAGGGTEATALRVTLANDSTGLVSVDDNGASLTVDAPAGTPVNVQIGDGTRQATVRDTGSSDSLNVSVVDASGNQVTTFGGGTEYTEDAAAAADPVGRVPILVRKDTPATITSTDGDNVAQRGTNYGAAYVQLVSSSGAYIDAVGGGVQYTEGGTDSTITGTAFLWEDTGDTLRPVSAATPLPISDAGGSLTVDGTVSLTGSVDTELPTPQGVVGGITPSASPSVIAYGYAYDGGTQWNRLRQADTAITNSGLLGAGLIGQLDDTATGTLSEDQFGVVRISSARRLLVDGSGVTQPVSGSVAVSGTVDTELANAQSTSADGLVISSSPGVLGANYLYDGASAWDRGRRVVDGLNSTGTGIFASGIIGQFDDTATSSVTENQFAVVRISSARRLLVDSKAPLTASSPTFVTVGAASGAAVAANSSRKGLILVNTSANTISLGMAGATAVLNSGPTLLPGGVYSMGEFDFSTGAVNAIASAASSNLAIQEFT